MFKNEFQGGPYVEVFHTQGKEMAAHWKLPSSGLKKTYDKEVKGYICILEGTPATTRMNLPKDNKQSLALVQRFLVFQLCIPLGQDFSIEVGMTDLNKNKRRLLLSTSVKESQVTPLHARIPLAVVVRRASWLNLVLDMVSFVGETWKGQTFHATESISLSANCKLRRIFTMRSQPPDTTDDDELFGCITSPQGEVEAIPPQCQLAPDLSHLTQVLTPNKIKAAEMVKKRGPAGDLTRPTSMLDIDLNASGRRSTHGDNYRIAFGTKVSVPSAGPDSSRRSARHGSVTSRSVRSNMGRSGDAAGSQGSLNNVSVNSSMAEGEDNSPNNSGSSAAFFQRQRSEPVGLPDYESGQPGGLPMVTPHPPREPSKDRLRRRPRVKNASVTTSAYQQQDRQSSAGSITEEPTTSGTVTYNGVSSSSGDKDSDPLSRESQPDDLEPNSGYVSSAAPAANGHSRAVEQQQSQGAQSQQRGKPSDALTNGRLGSADARQLPTRNHALHGHHQDSKDRDEEEEIEDLIAHLKQKIETEDEEEDIEDDNNEEDSDSDSAPGEYIESEEESDSHNLHMFASPPIMAPHRKLSPNVAAADVSRKGKRRSERNRLKRSQEFQSARGAPPEEDFFSRTSSEEEDTNPHARRPHLPPSSGARDNPRLRGDNRRGDSHGQVAASLVPPSSISPQQGPRGPFDPKKYSSPARGPSPSPNGPMSRLSRQSLREIPHNDIRLNGNAAGEPGYEAHRYEVADVTESFEARMLASMKRGQEEALEDLSPRKENFATPSSPQPWRHETNVVLAPGPASLLHTEFRYSDEETTQTSTWKPAPPQPQHNYQDEMRYRFSSDTLGSSNPRDWSTFSPPVTLMTGALDTATSEDLSDEGHMLLRAPQPEKKGNEEQLDLLYDSHLNCYYDPKTGKYYELAS